MSAVAATSAPSARKALPTWRVTNGAITPSLNTASNQKRVSKRACA